MAAPQTPTPAAVADAVLAVLPKARAAWLFGSGAHPERMTAASDVDIAVRLDAALSPQALWAATQALALRLHREVDLIDYDRAHTVMQVQILRTGVPLFDLEPSATAARNGRICTEYQHIQRWRQPMMAALAQRLLQAKAVRA